MSTLPLSGLIVGKKACTHNGRRAPGRRKCLLVGCQTQARRRYVSRPVVAGRSCRGSGEERRVCSDLQTQTDRGGTRLNIKMISSRYNRTAFQHAHLRTVGISRDVMFVVLG